LFLEDGISKNKLCLQKGTVNKKRSDILVPAG
jgi:hypothetical protein